MVGAFHWAGSNPSNSSMSRACSGPNRWTVGTGSGEQGISEVLFANLFLRVQDYCSRSKREGVDYLASGGRLAPSLGPVEPPVLICVFRPRDQMEDRRPRRGRRPLSRPQTSVYPVRA